MGRPPRPAVPTEAPADAVMGDGVSVEPDEETILW